MKCTEDPRVFFFKTEKVRLCAASYCVGKARATLALSFRWRAGYACEALCSLYDCESIVERRSCLFPSKHSSDNTWWLRLKVTPFLHAKRLLTPAQFTRPKISLVRAFNAPDPLSRCAGSAMDIRSRAGPEKQWRQGGGGAAGRGRARGGGRARAAGRGARGGRGGGGGRKSMETYALGCPRRL